MEKLNRKNVIWNIIGATANAFNSLLFAIVVTRINGINDAGIFTYSFATACLLYIIAVYAGRTFQVTDISGKNSDTDYIYHRILTCIIMIVISVIFVLVKKYDLFKSSIFILLCLFKCIEAFCEAIYAVLQRNNLLYKVGISMFLKAFICVIVFFVVDFITKNLLVSCLTIVLINFIVLVTYDFYNMKKIKIERTKISNVSIKRLFKVGFFTFLLTFLGNYLINAPRYALDDLVTNDLQTIFGIIIMPATIMGLLGQYIIAPCLTKIADSIKKQNYAELKKIISYLIGIIVGLGALVIVVACFLEVPVLELIYGVSLKPYFVSMIIIVSGSILYGLSTILSSILIAMRKTFLQAVMYAITAIIATALSYLLVSKFSLQGASITYFITMFIISAVFLIYIIINMKKYKEKWPKNENIYNNSNI